MFIDRFVGLEEVCSGRLRVSPYLVDPSREWAYVVTMLNFLLAFALFQSPTVLQSIGDGFPLVGQLHFEDGAEPAIVEIELRNQGDVVVLDRTTSNPAGKFYFDKVGLGRYWIAIESERYQRVQYRLEVDIRTFGMINLDLSLYPRRVLADGTPVVSLEELRRRVPKDSVEKLDDALEEFAGEIEANGIDRLEEALEIAPEFFEAHLELGFAEQRAGRREEAIASLVRADELNPASPEATTWLGRLYFETERFEEAVDTLTRRLGMGTPTVDDYFHIGSSYYKMGRFAEAEENLLHVGTLWPDEAGPSLLQLFNVYMRTRQPSKALEQLDAYVEAFPDAPDHDVIKQRADQLRQMLGAPNNN